MASLVPDADDLVALPVEEQGKLTLKLLAAHDSPRNPVAHSNFFNRADECSQSAAAWKQASRG
jgi:hypothetical protein